MNNYSLFLNITKKGKESSKEQVKGKKYCFKGECEKVKCARFVFANRCGIKQSGSICSDSQGLTRNISRFLNSLNILLSRGWANNVKKPLFCYDFIQNLTVFSQKQSRKCENSFWITWIIRNVRLKHANGIWLVSTLVQFWVMIYKDTLVARKNCVMWAFSPLS